MLTRKRSYAHPAFCLRTSSLLFSCPCAPWLDLSSSLHRWPPGVLGRLLIGLFALGGAGDLSAQPEAASSPSDSVQSDGPWVPRPNEVWQDAVDIGRGPFTLSARERWWTLGATGLIVGSAAMLDVPVFDHLSPRSRDGASDQARAVTTPLSGPGEWYDRRNPNRLTLGLVGSLATSGLLLRRRALTRTSVEVLEAVVYSELINGFWKSVLNRARPYVGSDPDPGAFDVGAFRSDHEYLAMPSGHAVRVFSIASVLSESADRWYVSVPLYAGASSVGIERVRSGDHWLTDVMVGAALGTLIGRSVAHDSADDDGPEASAGHDSVEYQPLLSTQRIGMQVTF